MKRYIGVPSLIFLLLLAGCASFLAQRIPVTFERPAQCQQFFDDLNREVQEAGVRDASTFAVPGFPYLRTSRFVTALKERLKDEREREQWVRWMQKLDLEARKKEIINLPDRAGLLLTRDQKGLYPQVEACSSELLNHDRTRSDFYSTLHPLVEVPTEYSFLMRTVGLYPLAALPVAVATESSRQKTFAWFHLSLQDLPVEGGLKTFAPGERTSLPEKEIKEMIRDSTRNPLGVPLPDEGRGRILVESFAPIFVQDIAGSYDWLGKIVWKGDGLGIDPEKPTVYYYISHAFLKGEPILQINYVIWYSERAGKKSPSMERGLLDGLTVRVSLDSQGRPFMVDVVNDCGCYHFFAPEKARVDRVISKPFGFDPFIPQWLPSVSTGKRLGIRINSGWHQVERLIAVGEPSDAISYELLPYDVLENLPHEDGRTESIFDAKGIVKCTERVERFILFSMGIPSVGSMRQRGHHALELIGRSHFDDPDLFDRNFVFK